MSMLEIRCLLEFVNKSDQPETIIKQAKTLNFFRNSNAVKVDLKSLSCTT